MANVSNIPVWREIGATPPPAVQNETAPVVIVGAGPVGLAMALDLGRRGHRVVVLSQLDFVAAGSKAICFAKRSLDIFDRLGVGDAIVDKGVIWNVGKVFWGDREEPVFQFDMLPVKNQKRPGFINIQQYHVEDRLIAALETLPNVELRWGHRMAGLVPQPEGARIEVETADGGYTIDADWVIACDGSRSAARDALGLDFEGRVFEDNFLIADVKMTGERPSERWFWFDPPFNPGQSALMHKQPDNVWRLDFQLGWNIDRAAAVKPENVDPLVRAMLGQEVAYEQEWYSVYTFQCRRMARFVHDRVIFAGDSAHLVSPFGARGCNGGLADVDNLGWKLDLILHGEAGSELLESYDAEAIAIADENILNSSRSTDFMTPKSAASRIYRDAVLELASEVPFARPFVNSGRLSTAVALPESPLNTPDADDWAGGGVAAGWPALDAPLGEGWLLERLGRGFVLLADRDPGIAGVETIVAGEEDELLRERYALAPGAVYLIRPDSYVCARWHAPDEAAVRAALLRAKGN
ncbi:FAD-dependent oxidoreductase [Sphingomonas koreensis]|jgi:3-(3-hydroxy-phenyl)propionate hydroxylase|uniref:FAD-dependent oxidoreductase n=1 Tax=Sphingomonas koreensis TaxID=93064 RepID=A0A1L6J8A1_9SPHN|nr:FAD-dependent oxidoreductase [Sphingomonas koreensis]APR52163.1 FAD-dependent oxidoreductase [Sphingomonas koreensis]MDC7812341.1 FAD-dependent oxidoreductase [Sphingomonas koreensis]RSU22971.1 FAD-dependent oxidoreductase [Sphingomonas koreensis]RSU26836.1 FAD-dependent oxidoreductase [Sphingomonas koreensis]RSU30556.1 FAD-dependent oxidoreductase [Sphingomonas koreensis]